MRRTDWMRLGGVGLAALAALGLTGARQEEPPPPWPVTEGAAPGYVPDSACVECHEERFHSFQRSPMSYSYYAMTPENAVEDLSAEPFFHEPSGQWYQQVRRGDDYYQRRWRVDEAGRRYAEFERRVDWVMGSGTHARTYLAQTPSGEVFQLPLSWYNGLGFAMSPGYDNPDHEGFHRPIKRRCMFCHNAFGEAPRGSDRHGELDRFPHDMPEGIDCQRCHGPGARHAELALDPDAEEEALRAAITHPAKLDPARTNDLCFQCHLQPTSALEDVVRRLGRSSLSFRPGEPLEDYNVHFDILEHGGDEDRFEINHHAFRLMQSPCFQESDGRMTCLSCHSPHNRPAPEERPEFYRRKCLACHQEGECTTDGVRDAHAADARDCAGCHMPERRTEDVVLATATDHLIRRAPAPDEWLEPLEEDTDLRIAGARLFFDGREPRGPERELYQALFQVRSGSTAALPTLAALLRDLQPGSAEPWLDHGDGCFAAGLYEEAAESYSWLVENEPERALGWRKLGSALLAQGRTAEALRHLRRAVELEPDHPDGHFELARALGPAKLQRALDHWRTGLELRPNDPTALRDMGALLLRAGRFAPAVTRLERALASEPRDAETYRLLGTAQVRAGRWAQAVTTWSRAAEVAELEADFPRDVALARLAAPDTTLHDAGEALRHARSAVELSPRDPESRAALALALYLTGSHEDALAAARRAEELGADARVTLGVRALALGRLGRNDEAVRSRDERARLGSTTTSPLAGRVEELLETASLGR